MFKAKAEAGQGSGWIARTGAWLGTVTLIAALVGPFGGVGVAQAATNTCPTDSSGNTLCTTTTTAASSPVLTISYHKSASGNPNLDFIKWQACNYPTAAIGSTAQLFIDGQPVTRAGGTGPIFNTTPPCTSDPEIIGCLTPGTYTSVAEVAGFANTNTATFVVGQDVACASPVVFNTSPGASSGASTTASSGPLAFTGANIFRLLLAAAVIILLGLSITMAARKRRRT